MRVWLSGTSIHAPAQSAAALISAYTAGADGAVLVIHSTLDGKIVCSATDDLSLTTGDPGFLHEFEYLALKSKNTGALFKNVAGMPVRHSAQLQPLTIFLEELPVGMELVLDLSKAVATARLEFIQATCMIVKQSKASKKCIYLIQDIADISAIRTISQQASIILSSGDVEAVIDLATAHSLAGVMIATADCIRFAQKITAAKFSFGAIAEAEGGILNSQQFALLSTQPFVYAATTGSVLLCEDFHFQKRLLCDEKFVGQDIDTDNWSMGYARANSYCHVYQNDGIHIDIAPYIPPSVVPAPDDIEQRLRRLETQVLVALQNTPTYSGGGVGFRRGLLGDFSVETLVSSQRAAQASTVEIAVVNGDPGRH